MPRTKKKSLDERELVLNDVVELLYNDATSVEKRMSIFNRLTLHTMNSIVFAEDNKNKSTICFIKCMTSDICGENSDILRKRSALYNSFKEQLPNYDLSGIFDSNVRIEPNDDILKVYENQKHHYDYRLVAFLDKLLESEDKEIFMRWLIFISCFPVDEPNDTYDYIDRITQTVAEIFALSYHPVLNDALDHFISRNFETDSELLEVNIAANHGLRWLDRHSRYPVLKKIIEKAQHVNILITEHNVSERFMCLIREPREVYDSEFTPSEDKWIKFCSSHRDKVTLKISYTPILRQYLEFKFKDDEYSALFVGFYTYGGIQFNDSYFMDLKKGNSYFDIFRNEFEYLFNLESPIATIADNSVFTSETAKEIAEGINNLDAVDQSYVLDLIKRLGNK